MRLVLAFACLVAVHSAAVAATDMRHAGMYSPQGTALPMLDSDVSVRVRGPLVEATVTQTFRNDTDKVTEATYIFPLPADAAVSAMSITSGSRTVHAAIEAREQAQQRYEAAVSAGVDAGLLEQERPDVFTQTVAAIPARGTVSVTLRFDTTAHYQAGTWELVLPLVVAPRYVAGTANGRPTTGTGRAPDTDRAPDASRVTPGGAPGAGGATTVAIELADPVTDVKSPTHELTATKTGYTFTDAKTDHDAIVRWKAKAPTQAWLERDSAGGFAAVLVEQKPAPAARKNALRLVLVVDHAATTRGDAEATQRPIVHALLSVLESRDAVALGGGGKLSFGAARDAQKAFDDAPPSKTPFDLTAVLGTLRGDHAIVLVTDGLVADDAAAIAAATKLHAPLHVIGIGPAPNRSLLARLAAATGGTLRFAVVGDDLAAIARDVLADAAAPPERVAITWGTLAVTEVVPAALPRLGAGQAALVLARVGAAKPSVANARVRGEVLGFVQVTTPKPPEGATSASGVFARRWAKLRLDDLIVAGDNKAIAAHALRYGLVSPVTSMVAIGSDVVIDGGVKHTVAVPVSVPGGMQWPLVKEQTTVDTNERAGDGKDAIREKRKLPKEEKEDKVAKKNAAPKEDKHAGTQTKTTSTNTKTPDAKPTRNEPVVVSREHRQPIATGSNERKPISAGAQRTPIAAGPSGVGVTAPVQASPPADEDSEKDTSLEAAKAEEPSEAPAPPPQMEPRVAADMGGSDGESMDDEAEDVVVQSGRRRAVRLSLALGGGLAVTSGSVDGFGAATARVEVGRRTMVGVEGSLWLVDGVHGQGSVLATLAQRGIARRLELGLGVGLRIASDAAGPALSLSLRTLLPVRRLALYLRYDGALLRGNDANTGINAGSAGIEAHW